MYVQLLEVELWSMAKLVLRQSVKGHGPLVITHLLSNSKPWPGSVVVERSPGMQEVSGSVHGRLKQKTLKF